MNTIGTEATINQTATSSTTYGATALDETAEQTPTPTVSTNAASGGRRDGQNHGGRNGRKIRPGADTTPGVSDATRTIKSAPSAVLTARQAKKDYSAPVGKRVQSMYPLQRPGHRFVRVCPDKTYRQMGVLTYKDPDTDEVYYVDPDVKIPETYGVRLSVTDLYAAVGHDGTYFVWPINRSETTWFRSAMKAVSMCQDKWLKVVARKGPNIYDLYEPADAIPAPGWSGLPAFEEMLVSAFDDRMIHTIEHPVMRKAAGHVDAAE